jgi:hypothetical protein
VGPKWDKAILNLEQCFAKGKTDEFCSRVIRYAMSWKLTAIEITCFRL